METKPVYTAKQAALLRDWLRGDMARYTVLSGSVRSGKTWISLVWWALWIAQRPKEGSYLMVGRTLETLDQNCLRPLQELVGVRNFRYNVRSKCGELFGRRVSFEGCSDARAEGKIRGRTLYGAYVDEATLLNEDFFAQLLARMSAPGAKLIATTNPDSPRHWLYTGYLHRPPDAKPIDLREYTFLLDDNTTLDPEYVQEIKNDYEGVFYQRNILGLWVVAAGAIYRYFAEHREQMAVRASDADYDYIQIGLDFGGNRSAHALTATGLKYDCSRVTALASRRLPATDVDPLRLYAWVEDFLGYVRRTYGREGSAYVGVLYADSAEQTLKNGLKARLDVPVRDSVKNRITDRIRVTTALMASGRFAYVAADCKTLEEALCTAVWDETRLEDVRLDDGTSDIDTLDSFEYSWESGIKYYQRGTQ